MYDAIVSVLELRLRSQILKNEAILNLRNTDNYGEVLVHSSDVEEHTLHIRELCLILVGVPLLSAIGQKLLIVSLGIVDRVEEVLEVVEDYLMGHLREAREEDCHK